MKEWSKLTQQEWEQIKARAKAAFVTEIMGERPTYQTVRDTMPNPFRINPLEWGAILVLVFLAAFTGYKLAAVAVPFADSMATALTQETYIESWVLHSFQIVTAIMFVLMGTFSLIYFKLLDTDKQIVEMKEKTKYYKGWRRLGLDWISPRLPYMIVYGSALWLFIVSSAGLDTVTFENFSPFERYLPIVLEIGLAHLVGELLIKQEKFHNLVIGTLDEQCKPYDERLAGYEADPEFLKILHRYLRAGLLAVERLPKDKLAIGRGRKFKVNAWLHDADGDTLDKIILAEYKRLTGGMRFAREIIGTTSRAKPSPQAKTGSDERRIPPAGDKKWTAGTLVRDLKIRQVTDPNYGENQLAADYAPGYGARAAWRNGGRELYNQQ